MLCVLVQSRRLWLHNPSEYNHPAGVPVKDPSKKGKTLEELEQEEGGIIKESQVPMAQLKRAQKRKGKAQTGGLYQR